MSHKHHNNNYTNYSKPQNVAPAVEAEVKEEVVTPVIEEPAAPVEEPVIEEVKEIIGVVTECAKLNVRKAATTDSDVVTTLLIGTEVMIDEEQSTEDFYKICTEAGIEGYCMKKFINIGE